MIISSETKSQIKFLANELKMEKKAQAVSLPREGSSIRAIERVTRIHRDTAMRPGVPAGKARAKMQDEKTRGLNFGPIEVDEIWGFIGAKRNQAAREAMR